MRVFVYGTLKQGGGLHHILAEGNAKFLCCEMLYDVAMYDLGSYPAAVPEEGAVIHGEVYDVDEVLLRRLDQAEGVPYLYRREMVINAIGACRQVYFYNRPVRQWRKITDGYWPVEEATA